MLGTTDNSSLRLPGFGDFVCVLREGTYPQCYSLPLAYVTWTAWLVHCTTHQADSNTGEIGRDSGSTCHALGIVTPMCRCRLWQVLLFAFSCHAG